MVIDNPKISVVNIIKVCFFFSQAACPMWTLRDSAPHRHLGIQVADVPPLAAAPSTQAHLALRMSGEERDWGTVWTFHHLHWKRQTSFPFIFHWLELVTAQPHRKRVGNKGMHMECLERITIAATATQWLCVYRQIT